jgi:DNA-binding NarL/FixJ family response regulator
MDNSAVRLLIVSPLAGHVVGRFLGIEWGHAEAATTPAQVAEVARRERPRFDVVLVDLMWNTFQEEWTFDGLDVLEHMVRSERQEPALLACQGHGFERDYLEEGRHHPLVRGMILKGDPGPVLLEAIGTIAGGGRFEHGHLNAALRRDHEALGHWFARNLLLARVAGAIAAGHGASYAEIARVLGVSTSTVEKSPALFREVMAPRGEVGPDGDVGQAAIFRWCGEHAHYILSWCRRHRDRYRELSSLPPEVFVRQGGW